MLTLGAAATLNGKAGTNAAITYTVFGDEYSSSTNAFKILAQGQLGTSAATPLYTVPGSTQTLIKEILLANTTGSNVSGVILYANGSAAGNQLTGGITIPANGSAVWDGSGGWHVYDANGVVQYVGSTGPQGTQGIQGIQGIQGNTGAAGVVQTVTALDTSVAVAGTTNVTVSRGPLTGDVTASTGAQATTIAASAVTNAKLANMNAHTYKGNNTGSAAAPADITNTQLTADLNAATASLQGMLSAADYGHVLSGWYDVTRQGGNSLSTGASGSTNATALGNIMSAAPSGSVLYFPPGWYPMAGTITIPNKVFIFQGSGSGLNGALSAITYAADNAGTWITQTGADYYMQFRDMGFIALAAQSAGYVLDVNGNANNHVYNCTFTGLSSSFTLKNVINFAGGNGGEESIVYGCDFTNFTGTGISCNCNLETVVIDSCTMNGGAIAACGINVHLGGAAQIVNCDIIGCTNNLLIDPVTATVVASVWATNTYFDSSGGSCVKITGAGATVRCKFEECSMTCSAAASPANAVEVSSTFAYGAVGMGLDFTNCNVLNTFGTLGVGTGFNITGAGDFRIQGCNIAAWATGIAVTPANAAGMTRPQINGNTIGNAGGYGVNTTGINLAAGSFTYGAVIITDNAFSNTTNIVDASTLAAASAGKIIANNTGQPMPPQPMTAASAAINTTETYPALALPLPANSLLVGSTYRLTLIGICTSTAANISTFTVRVGTTGTTPASDTTATFAFATTAAATSGSAIPFTAVITVTCRAIGASAQLAIALTLINTGVTGIMSVATGGGANVTPTFNSNANLFLNVSYKTAATTTTSTFAIGAWEVIKQ